MSSDLISKGIETVKNTNLRVFANVTAFIINLMVVIGCSSSSDSRSRLLIGAILFLVALELLRWSDVLYLKLRKGRPCTRQSGPPTVGQASQALVD